MKGIILAGGFATRLYPSTLVTSKQLLPVYDRPMIFYPLNTLIKAGIRDILIIVTPDHAGDFINLLGSIMESYGITISFKVQTRPGGLPEAFVYGENHIDEHNVALILGDNIFEDDFSPIIKNFKFGCHLFAKRVPDPHRFGVIQFDSSGKPIKIIEKPTEFISDYAITGLYLYDSRAVEISKRLKPSVRGEIEIVDLHNYFLQKDELAVTVFKGEWLDAGTHDSLLDAGNMVKEKKLCQKFDPIIDQAVREFCMYKKEFLKK